MNNVHAQDPIFSQFYANPLYLNPALAGTHECSRIMFHYRNQWPSVSGGFKTYALSADTYVDALSGGLGLMVYSDDAAGIFNTLSIGGIYAYHLTLSTSSSLNAGIEASYYQQKLNWNKLIFSDMIDRTTGTIDQSATGETQPDRLTVSNVDFAGGLVLGINKKYYFGIAGHHLSQPDLGFYSSDSNPLYIKYTAHMGALFNLIPGDYRTPEGKLILNPNVLYQIQQNTQQLNAGFNLEFAPLFTGIWFRHNFTNPDAVLFLLGLKHKRFNFGYSYDLTLSKLKGNSGGGHELSLTLFIGCGGKRNKPGAIKCPEF